MWTYIQAYKGEGEEEKWGGDRRERGEETEKGREEGRGVREQGRDRKKRSGKRERENTKNKTAVTSSQKDKKNDIALPALIQVLFIKFCPALAENTSPPPIIPGPCAKKDNFLH